jgi:hypothetical protein
MLEWPSNWLTSTPQAWISLFLSNPLVFLHLNPFYPNPDVEEIIGSLDTAQNILTRLPCPQAGREPSHHLSAPDTPRAKRVIPKVPSSRSYESGSCGSLANRLHDVAEALPADL